jgi:membrane protease YdiL (CAAX protease family)
MVTTATTPSRTIATTTTGAFPLKYFVMAFAFAWFFWGLQLLGVRGVIPTLPGLTGIATLGPLVAAVVITAQEGGRAGLRSLLGRVVRWRVALIWYAVALLGPLVLTLGAIGLHVAFGGQPPSLGSLIEVLPMVLIAFVFMMIFVALGEEVGWRGYALPALQARYGALTSSVILGVMWGLWHLPLFFNPSAGSYSDLPFGLWLAYLIPFAVLITWLFNSTEGSVLMAMFVHAVMNASGEVWKAIPQYSTRPESVIEAAAETGHVYLMLTIAMWIAAVVVVLVYGSRNLSRRPRQELATASGGSHLTREQ